ncbi:SusC/RagA family TonB-linked outer membrane protein [Siphonobacter aquaeclarae]|uniref:TonB-linked outer membrane protein, SusC/RagA family n=1 Tax=Siphonobacter aquaeclarae TaxID=563176 RepID=A0A1G9YB90_9BACT|nr:TonB-dependent receptor [Siphonobacter aquaeclarae]SDN06297.1 TonB-linked outer membrane protein, SusC/RagA family [Siphonobacter aquaeclarae]
MKNPFTYLLLFLLFGLRALAADPALVVTGTVTAGKAPLPGVSVAVKGTTTGTVTDAAGKYSLNIPGPDAVLVFTSVGYVSKEVPVGGRTVVDVALDEDQKQLNEVVVVGYGTQKKVNVTGAVATVSGDEMIRRPVTNPTSMLQGTMPGVQITQGTGEPGNEGLSIRIRGTGTFSGAGSDPLVLIDGVQGNLSDLNPNNIENVSVLKDAASASIYGARAANGVILVTTKKGSEGRFRVQYSGNYALYQPTKLFKLITNSAEYMELYNEARLNSGLTSGLYSPEQISAYRNATDRNLYPNTDWLSLIFRTAPTQNHNLTFEGGKGGTRFNASLGYVNQKGIMRGFDFEKYNARLNLTSQISNRVSMGANIALKHGKTLAPVFGSEDMFLSAMSQAPTYAPTLADGSGRYTYKAYDFEYNNKNPIALLDGHINRDKYDYSANTQGWVQVNLLEGLTWYTKGAVNVDFYKTKSFKPPLQLYNFRTNQFMTTLDLGGGLEDKDEFNLYTNLYTYLDYAKTFAGHHAFKLQAGYSTERNNFQYLQGTRRNFPTDLLRELDAGSPSIQYANGSQYQWAIQSLFGRLNYNYRERYLLEANLRYDGTSRLAKASRWGIFPSFSAGWRVTEEEFFKNLNASWVNSLKIRGSWGQLGNQNIGNYPYQAILSFTGNYPFDDQNLSSGVAQTNLSNANIKWETTTIADVGLDLTLFRGLNLTADWYKKTTTDILRSSQVTGVVGLGAPTINNGTMQNTGIELGLSYHHQVSGGLFNGLNYTAGINLEHYKNKLVTFGQREIDGYRIREEGREWNTYYMLEVQGIFQTAQEVANAPKQYNDATVPGDLRYKDQNGDGVINDNDRVVMSGNYPGLNYSGNFSANWKGFDLSFMFQGVNSIRFYVDNWGTVPFVQGSPPTTDWRNRWTETNPSTTMPRIYWGWGAPDRIRRTSSYFLQDASYARLKNLTFGYSLPASVVKRLGMEGLRVYFSGDNLITLTKYRGLDPERGGSGSFVQYPQNKIFSLGVNLKF